MNLTPEQAKWLRERMTRHVETFRGGNWSDANERAREHMRFCLAEADCAQSIINAIDESEACRL